MDSKQIPITTGSIAPPKSATAKAAPGNVPITSSPTIPRTGGPPVADEKAMLRRASVNHALQQQLQDGENQQ
ncbi:hypothetical protein BZG36_03353 [Bifiguratus adelaidae]|uniref:Uncharacterized protein n=1 Tax=Bifiguratus adelaidae TaxID=1938954 RepID=A0A261XWN4_9FUNG|nr:hypothetical protein BZG36_03353 [Bifiguratus adelaidae]